MQDPARDGNPGLGSRVRPPVVRNGRLWQRCARSSAVVAAALVLAACGAAGAAPAGKTSAAPATVQVAHNAKFGAILVNAQGMTLYSFTKDSKNNSACSGACAQLWPPLTVSGSPTAGSGVTGTIGTFSRSDGSSQVTCNGVPLYTYAADKSAGQVNGQGKLGLWFAVQPNCGAVPASTAAATTTTTTTATTQTGTTSTKTGGSAWG